MRVATIMASAAIVSSMNLAQAQCFSRTTCDPDALEVHSQLSVNVPVSDQAKPSEAIQVMEDARRQLTSMSLRECDVLKTTFDRDCTLTSVSANSNLQDRGAHKTAYVSISNSYQLRRLPK